MTNELKPVRCGCGGEAEVLHPSYTHCIVVMCGKCGIKTPYMNSEAEAITTWNRAMGATDKNVGDKERKKGEWIYDGIRGRFPACKCSICGHYENADWALSQGVNYCPNCGAEMSGE